MLSSHVTGLLSLGGSTIYPQMEVTGWYRRVTTPDSIVLVLAVGYARAGTHVTVTGHSPENHHCDMADP